MRRNSFKINYILNKWIFKSKNKVKKKTKTLLCNLMIMNQRANSSALYKLHISDPAHTVLLTDNCPTANFTRWIQNLYSAHAKI